MGVPLSIEAMANPTPYVLFPGTAREALTFYAEVFECAVELHTYAEFNRTDGPGHAVAHGLLRDGPVDLYAADVAGDELPVRAEGIMLALLGSAPPTDLARWFDRLSDGGHVIDGLQPRSWGATDGRVVDRFGLEWLIGYEH